MLSPRCKNNGEEAPSETDIQTWAQPSSVATVASLVQLVASAQGRWGERVSGICYTESFNKEQGGFCDPTYSIQQFRSFPFS